MDQEISQEKPRSTVLENITKCVVGNKTITFSQGRYSKNGVTLDEVSVNNKILRISLPKVDLKDLQVTYRSGKRKLQQTKETNSNKRAKTESFVSNYNESLRRQKGIGLRSSDKSRLSIIDKAINRLMTKNLEQPTSNIRVKKPSQLFKNASPEIKRREYSPKPYKSLSTKAMSKKLNNNTLKKHDSSERKSYFGPTSSRRFSSFSENSEGKIYCLKFLPYSRYTDRKLNYKFSQLAVDVRTLKLPTPNWKIRIFVTNKQISSIKFSNKQEVERCVTFNSDSNVYGITIDNKKAVLLGSPITLDTRKDIEVLLDIVHFIHKDNAMIRYIT